jgi:hypothetical protein
MQNEMPLFVYFWRSVLRYLHKIFSSFFNSVNFIAKVLSTLEDLANNKELRSVDTVFSCYLSRFHRYSLLHFYISESV